MGVLVFGGPSGQAWQVTSGGPTTTSAGDEPVGDAGPADTLGERAHAMISFEATWFTQDQDRHDAIRARFACSVEEYNLELSRVIDHPAAVDIDPLVVRRLRRNRDRRRRAKLDGVAADAGSAHRVP